ncbi:histone H1-like [Amblyraja radiata]|uniref:histone H1-like n=1 Tax=Amblyraja radiata TaxID=386614 RepID=UPI0014026C77|nr:histone H1-like [Amblyraja radiata]
MESPGVDFSTAATSLLLQSPLPPVPAVPPPPPPLLLPEETDSLDIAVAVKKKRRPYRHRKFGCTVAEQIMRAVAATKERRGLSVAAVKKLLSASGYDLARHNTRVNRAVRTLVSKGSLVQTTGSGASGSVRLGKCPQDVVAAAAAFKLPLGAAARRTVLSRRPAAKKCRRLVARGGGGGKNRRRRSQLKKAGGRHHRKAGGGGGLKKVTARWNTVRARRALAKGRTFRRRAKVEAKVARDSVKPTDLVDEKATLSQNTEPNKC